MIRLVMTAAGVAFLAVLALAVHAGPHAWLTFLHLANAQAQHYANQLNARLPLPRAGHP